MVMLITVIGLIGLTAGLTLGQVGAKALFYEGTETMGLTYWVELVDANNLRRRVTSDYVFRSGDRFKLHLMSNRDGYLTLVNLGTTGRSQVIFPNPALGEGNNFVRAFTDYEAPKGYLRFDNNPGEEVLVVMLTPAFRGQTPSLPSGISVPASGEGVVQPPMPGGLSEPGLGGTTSVPPVQTRDPRLGTVDPAGAADALAQAAAQAVASGAKDLVMEVDRMSARPATYAVTPLQTAGGDGGRITFQIRLVHR